MTAPPVVPGAYGVFQTTLDAVYDLCPEAERVTDANASQLPTPITEDTVARWIEDISNAVSAGIGPWPMIAGPAGERIQAAAKAVIANGAASYLQAARYPTRASSNDSTYSGVLWLRYQQGLDALKAQVTAIIDEGGTEVVPEPGAGTKGPYGAFPPTYFADGTWW